MPVSIPESRECINCSIIGPLNVNGCCSTCGSDAVVPLWSMPQEEAVTGEPVEPLANSIPAF